MKHQANRNYQSNDRIYTPDPLAVAIAAALQPSGRLLEPCEGKGAFTRALRPYGEVLTLEWDRGDAFTLWQERVDWVITNPPWSRFSEFLLHAMEVADHVCLLATVNHFWTKYRVRTIASAGFGYQALLLIDWPKDWPPSGFQLGLMHLRRGWRGPTTIAWLPWDDTSREPNLLDP